MKLYKLFTTLFVTLLSTQTSAMDVPASSTFSSMPCGALYGLGLGVSLTCVVRLMKGDRFRHNFAFRPDKYRVSNYSFAVIKYFVDLASVASAPFLAALSLNELNKVLGEKGFALQPEMVNPVISGLMYLGSIGAGIYGACGLTSCVYGIRDFKNRDFEDGILRMVIGAAATAIATPFVYHGVTGRNAPTWLTGASCAGIFGLALAQGRSPY